MATIVGGFVMPHDPLIFINPQKKDRKAVMHGFEVIRDRIDQLNADTAIIIGADHYILFGPDCLPQMVIGTGDAYGPIDQLPGLARRPAVVNDELAKYIRDDGHRSGFDWATSKSMGYDHAIGTPAQMCLSSPDIPIIPIYLASGVEPYIPLKRAYELGQQIGRAVSQYQGNDRVVVLGSGGISHWVGMAEMGRINSDFDEMVLNAVITGDVDALLALSDDEILDQGGNGAMEIRQFVCTMGAVENERGSIIAYEPWSGGVTGLGFAELLAA